MTGFNGASNPMHKIAITILNDWLANMNREDLCFMAFSFPSRAGTTRPPSTLQNSLQANAESQFAVSGVVTAPELATLSFTSPIRRVR
jgi:hypothetical protein